VGVTVKLPMPNAPWPDWLHGATQQRRH